MTVNRRLHRALQQLAASLADLYPDEDDPDPAAP
jgi:DNA-directed RNA polymerase specialized sigma24 family protein